MVMTTDVTPPRDHEMTTNTNEVTDLVPSLSLDAMLQKREDALERLSKANTLILEARALIGACFPAEPDEYGRDQESQSERTLQHAVDDAGRNYVRVGDDKWVESVTKNLDKSLWEILIGRSGLMTFMDAEARTAFLASIHNDAPPMSRANVQATIESLHANRGEMFERGVINLFRKVSWQYKTNRGACFGKRLILGSFMSSRLHGWLGHHGEAMTDLERAFFILDGKPEPDHRHNIRGLINDACREKSNTLVHEYFKLKWFKKGSAHLEFTRPDLVDKLNAILTKHHPDALPAAKSSDRR